MKQLNNEQLKVLLIGDNVISLERFEIAQKEAEEKKIPLLEYLPETEYISDEQLGQILANYLKYDYINLRNERINEETLQLIPELVARSKGVIAFARDEESVKIGMLDPEDIEVRHSIEKRVAQKVSIFFITKKALQNALSLYKASIRDAFEGALEKLEDVSMTREERDEASIGVVDMLMQYGYDNKASDIHIEPYKEKVLVRFRIDGVLHDVLDIPNELSDVILTRIKILAKMRTDEHRAAQDGKFQFETREEGVDVRVSIVPVSGGEKIVMRLLSAKARKFDFVSLGFTGNELKKVEDAVEKPHGMILVTGPTGSGKTTTIYGIMKILNKRDVNISTIEDPVEYAIEGVNQIQVNAKTNLTFAQGLRALVRQDPDIIMVGEIRDEETADIAVNSAMTGHLVLSTLHANTAPGTFPRLLDMGVEPFLIASTVNIVIAQRLVRKISEKNRASYIMTESEKKIVNGDSELKAIFTARGYENLDEVRLYKGVGGVSGYTGRVGVFEVLEMTDGIKDLIIKRAPSNIILEEARAGGMITMLEDGINKVFQGITTLEEVLRVTRT